MHSSGELIFSGVSILQAAIRVSLGCLFSKSELPSNTFATWQLSLKLREHVRNDRYLHYLVICTFSPLTFLRRLSSMPQPHWTTHPCSTLRPLSPSILLCLMVKIQIHQLFVRLNQIIPQLRAEEMAQWATFLLRKCVDLCSDLQHPWKSWPRLCASVGTALRQQCQEGLWGLLASPQPNLWAPGSVRGLFSKSR